MGICSTKNKVEEFDQNVKLSEKEMQMIRNSWAVVEKEGLVKYGTNLMMRIFLEHRELKPLWQFSKELETTEQMNSNALLKAHGEKLLNAFDLVIRSLEDLSTLEPILIQLGRSHYGWGVRDKYFPYIGDSLIGVLSDGLKEKFTPELKVSWLKLFTIIKSIMIIGMVQAELK